MLQISAPLHFATEPCLQDVEIAAFVQLPSFQIVGLPGQEVSEARERIRAAIEASGFDFPKKRIVLNLAPSNIKKRGTGSDLAMALSILFSRLETHATLLHVVASGELGLDGSIKAAGQITRTVYAAWQARAQILLLAEGELAEAHRALALIRAAALLPLTPPMILTCQNLNGAHQKITAYQKAGKPHPPAIFQSSATVPASGSSTLMTLPPYLERAISVAAAGNHHILLLGPRGSGKSHAFEWLIALQPSPPPAVLLNHLMMLELKQGQTHATHAHPQDADDADDADDAEVAGGHSTLLVRKISCQIRPSALVGSASAQSVRPGEFSLAHGGVLIADEFPEWPRDSREALREPLETGKVIINRAQGRAELPAQFILAANGNLCPCGGWPPQLPIPEKSLRLPRCKCAHATRTLYLNRLSGPILDRIDMTALVVPKKQKRDQASQDAGTRLLHMKEMIKNSQDFAHRSWGKPAGDLQGAEVEAILKNSAHWSDWNDSALFSAPISLRGRHKIARLALTLASLEQQPEPNLAHFHEASIYRIEATGLLN